MELLALRHQWKSAHWLWAAVVALSSCSDDGSESKNQTAGTDSGTVTAGMTSSGTTSATSDGPSSASTASANTNTSTSAAAVTNTSGGQNAAGGSGGTSSDGPTTGAAGDGGSSSAAGGATGSTSTTGGGDSVPSAGCDAETPPSSGRATIDVDGTEREYILRLPEDYDPARPYPLILAWHGAQYSAEWVDSGDEPQTGPYFGILEEADGNAIFVAPDALPGSWSNQDGRDLAFADALVERFEAELCLDESRLFSVGFSMGAIMTLRIGCARADKFRAIAPLSGRLPDDCAEGDTPIAYFTAHGDVDMTITDDEGMLARDEFARRNGCSEETVDAERERCVSSQGCDPGYPVEWCSFSGEHTPAPFAGEAIWQFFSQF